MSKNKFIYRIRILVTSLECTERSYRMSRISYDLSKLLSIKSKNLYNRDCSQGNYLQDQHITIGYIE